MSMRRKASLRPGWFGVMVSGLIFGTGAAAWAQSSGQPAVEFDRDIRPLLTDRCYACHGPDGAARTTKLRFDTKEGAFPDLGGYHAIVPGDPDRSEMFKRIASEEAALRMPPVYSGLKLGPQGNRAHPLVDQAGGPVATSLVLHPPQAFSAAQSSQ